MTHLGRLLAVMAGALLVIGAAVFLFFRSSIASEGVYRVANAVGLNAAAPERHIVPEHFEGWAVAHYGVADAPPLPENEGARILEYPPSGRLETSTPAPEDEGFIHRGYYRQTVDGLAPMSRLGEIWGEYTHLIVANDGSDAVGRSTGFFVGTMKQFRATEWPAEHGFPARHPG